MYVCSKELIKQSMQPDLICLSVQFFFCFQFELIAFEQTKMKQFSRFQLFVSSEFKKKENYLKSLLTV